MNTIFSPARLEILLHFRYSPKPHPWQERIADTLREFIDEGLLQEGSQFDANYSLTPMGEKYIDMILETPYPVPRWIDPRTERRDNTQLP